MNKHLDELLKIIPDVLTEKILDLGAGRGEFVRTVLDRGGKAEGVEPYDKYIEMAKNISGVDLKIGTGEKIPFENSVFGFVNMAEVIEHVTDPALVMKEVHRVLAQGGQVYVSVPNRFGLKDQHFHLYFVNWLPRRFAGTFISVFGKHKDYTINNGLQKLTEMHYMTYRGAKIFFERAGFKVEDIREIKMDKKFSAFTRVLAKLAYRPLKYCYFDSFHFLLIKC